MKPGRWGYILQVLCIFWIFFNKFYYLVYVKFRGHKLAVLFHQSNLAYPENRKKANSAPVNHFAAAKL